MKLSLVTTPPSVRSGIGDYTRHLLPYLRERCDVEVFVRDDLAGEDYDGLTTRSVHDLDPRATDRILYQLGNEGNHAFMAPVIRAIGGTVMQHDWVLFDLALAAYPGLARGGLKGHALALREGGVEQARVYWSNWLARRREKHRPPLEELENPHELVGTFLCGWHAPEASGRWAADRALFRVPPEARRVRVRFASEPGRRVELFAGGALRDGTVWGKGEHREDLVAEVEDHEDPVLVLGTQGISVSPEQRKHGDTRRLGTFVKEIVWEDARGEHALDLSTPCARPIVPVSLSRDRFLLPFNRSVVRFADAFIVHSHYVKQLILQDRNSLTPVGVLHHGAERRWHDEDRAAARVRAGLPEAWRGGFLVTSFGGVQPHKRIDKLLKAVALARAERPDIYLVLAGKVQTEGFDPVATSQMLGLEDAVHFPGFVDEEHGWDLLHAGDICVNLRGPTSGGTSGGIFQAFAQGRAVVASDAAEQRELPDSCTVKVPLGDGEARALARVLVELRDDPARRDALEAAARRFVDEECHWSHMAEKYVEYLEAFPRARASLRSLIAMRLAEGKERRA